MGLRQRGAGVRPRRDPAHALADTPKDLFRSIDPDHVARELKDRRVVMVGVQPGDAGIVIATVRSMPTKAQPSATTNGIPLRFVNVGKPLIRGHPVVTVSKVGRRTELTTCSVTGRVTGDTSVGYDQPRFRADVHYLDMIAVEGAAERPFAQPGDPGSLVVADIDGRKRSLGIVFAVSVDECLTWVMPMERVLADLGVTLEGNHNVLRPGSGGGP